MEKVIRNILFYAQATQDEKIKCLSDLCDELIYNTMYYVRTHTNAKAQTDKKVADAIKVLTKNKHDTSTI